MGRTLDLAIGLLNGAIGDHLARTANPLATPMQLVHEGTPLRLEPAVLARTHPAATRRAVVLVHGMMNTEAVWDAPEGPGRDYGARLARDLGYTPWYVRYNSGLAIADNGADLARLLDDLVAAYPGPLEELLLLGYSMGGLVVRSACHVAAGRSLGWLALVRRAVYVGTPHRGAPLERAGRVLVDFLGGVPDPTTRLVSRVADLRSDGVKDLGDADLRHEDRARRVPTLGRRAPEPPVPLPHGIAHLLVAGTVSLDPRLAAWLGDAVVPLGSATDDGRAPREVRLAPGVGHLALAHDPAVYEHIRAFCAGGAP